MKRVLWITLSTYHLAACGGGAVDTVSLFDGETAQNRVFVPTSYDTLWTFGGAGDTILSAPTFLLPARNGGVFLYDIHLQQAHHIDSGGVHAWKWGRRGEGPGELQNVRAMTEDASGRLVLVDSGNSRIVTLDPDGNLSNEVALNIDASTVYGVVGLESGDYVMDTAADQPWFLVDRNGKSIGTPGIPWDEGFTRMSFVQRNGKIVHWKDDRWVFAFLNGNGWFSFRTHRPLGAFPYVEHVEFPIAARYRHRFTRSTRLLERPIGSAASLSVRADTLVVLFRGHTSGRLRTLDKYDLHTGRYLNSQLLPHFSNGAVVGPDGTIFTIYSGGLYPKVTSLRSRPAIPTKGEE